MAIYTIHGVVYNKDPKILLQRNLLDYSAFIKHLKSRSIPYVDINRALSGHGDALTIDDSTIASYNAGILARKYGHEVTLFVNTCPIDLSLTYSSVYLDYFIDSIEKTDVLFNEEKI